MPEQKYHIYEDRVVMKNLSNKVLKDDKVLMANSHGNRLRNLSSTARKIILHAC